MFTLTRFIRFSFSVIFILLLSCCSKREKACFTLSADSGDTSTVFYFDPSCSELCFSFTWSFGDRTPDTTILG